MAAGLTEWYNAIKRRTGGTDRDRVPLLLAFLIPVAVMIAVIILNEIYPFGDRCFLRVDMYNQYMPFFTEFHRKLRQGGSLLFSWHAGLGANFVGLYAYYLASPMNWLLILCPEEYIIEFMTVLIVIKIGLCGLSFAWYLRRHFRTDSYSVTIFAVLYALSGYMAAYNWNIMWLDCIALTPLVILGLEELVKHGRCRLYCVSLAFCILTNYYISILLCVFLVLYFLILLFSEPLCKVGAAIKNFTCYSMLAGGMAGAVLIPGTLALRSTKFDQINFPNEIKFYFNIFQILARHCINVATEIRNDHWPNIYCGALVLLLIPLYVCCRKVSWREKLPKLLLLAFFLLSFSMNVLNFIWHGLNYPDSLPARQSFLYIFLVLVMSYEAFVHLHEFRSPVLFVTVGGTVLFVYLCSRFVKNEDFSAGSFVFTMIYLVVYGLILYWNKGGGLKKPAMLSLLFGLVITETFMNTLNTSVPTTSRSKYRSDFEANKALLEELDHVADPFYRIEEFGRMTKNDGMLAGFPTATMFSSTTNADMAHLYRRLGMSSSKVFYSYEGATPLSSALLSVDYMFSDSLEITDDFHELVEQKEGNYLYRNKFSLPVGYMVPAELEENWDFETGTPVGVQNSLVRALGIDEALFRPLEVSSTGNDAEIHVEAGCYVYAFTRDSKTRDLVADVNGVEKKYEKVDYPHIIDLGWCDGDSDIWITQTGTKRSGDHSLELQAYELDLYTLRKAIHRLGGNPFTVEEVKDTYLRGTIDVRQAGLMATSIPAEGGWSVKVDGVPVRITPFAAGAMIGVELSEGQHTVEFTYRAPGILIGAVVSAASIALFVLLCRMEHHDRKRRQRKAAA